MNPPLFMADLAPLCRFHLFNRDGKVDTVTRESLTFCENTVLDERINTTLWWEVQSWSQEAMSLALAESRENTHLPLSKTTHFYFYFCCRANKQFKTVYLLSFELSSCFPLLPVFSAKLI